MLNIGSIKAIEQSKFEHGFIKPLYKTYCFSNIPQTIKNILTDDKGKGFPDDIFGHLPKKYSKVILFFVDAFSWDFFEKNANKYPLLKRFLKKGAVSKITSQFPSTTSAHTTTIHSGLPVSKTGIHEWYYYEPCVDAIIAPLTFSFVGKKDPESLKNIAIEPERIYPKQNIYKDLKKQQVKSYVFNYMPYANSTYSKIMSAGAKRITYNSISEVLAYLTEIIKNENGKSYYFIYFDKIDTVGHIYGPSSAEYKAEVGTFLNLLEKQFFEKLEGKLSDTLLLMTADHGQTDINPKTTIYINKMFPIMEKYIKTNRAGKMLVPAGSCRDMFLYIKDRYLNETHRYLEKRLKNKAAVYRVSDLITKQIFGSGKPSKKLLDRIGNLVILPFAKESVWWYEKNKFEIKQLGHHGGLTKNEMEIPLFLYAF